MTELRPGIHWVGDVEWSLEFFHGHELSIRHGTSYNSFLIMDEKIALIESVKGTHAHNFVDRVRALVPLEKIDYFIILHSEPDHSGAFPLILEKAKNAKVLCSKNGALSIQRHYPGNWNLSVVKTNDSISLGKRSLRFFEAQMLHWPDSTFAYCPDEKLLFSNDAFGQHLAASSRFTDEVEPCLLWNEAVKYFANILTPFCPHIIRKIQEFTKLGWPVEAIYPSHGLLWRKDPMAIVNKYLEWASGKADPSAVVLFDTIWQGTERMAQAIARGLQMENVPYRLYNAGSADFNDVMTEVLTSKGVLVGSPTLNNGLMPTLMPSLESLRNLRFPNKMGAAFGTYGWSGEGVKRIEEFLAGGGIKIAQPGLRVQFSPTEADLKECETFGRGFAKLLKEPG
jgi:flavorubredoxin